MVKTTIPALLTTILIISVLCFSCSSSRYQQGFSYQPTYSGPNVSGSLSTEKEIPARDTLASTTTENIYQQPAIHAPANALQTDVLANIIQQEYHETAPSAQPLNNREAVHNIATKYASSQNITLTNKQLRKLDRFAAKMEKKQKRGAQDVQWGPSNNLEWFVLLGAGVALVTGILGIGFGWFVFLGLALVYLYLKLLKNN